MNMCLLVMTGLLDMSVGAANVHDSKSGKRKRAASVGKHSHLSDVTRFALSILAQQPIDLKGLPVT